MSTPNFDWDGWRKLVADKLGRAAGRDCLVCWTEQGAIEVTFQELLHSFNKASAPSELVMLNYLLSNIITEHNF